MATEFTFQEASEDSFGFEDAKPIGDQYDSQLRAAPPESMVGSGLRAVRELFSPIIGPSPRQIAEESVQMPDGTMAYRPLGGRAEQEGLIPSLFMQNPESPLFINRAEIDPSASAPRQIATGARNVGANLVNALSSPGSMLTLGAGGLMSPAATKAIGGAFAADVARYVPEMAQEAGRASAVGTPGEMTEAFGNLGLGVAGVLGGGIHAAQSTPRGNALRAIQGIVDEGPQMSPPDVAAVAALDPAIGQWQPLSPARIPAARMGEQARAARSAVEAENFRRTLYPEPEPGGELVVSDVPSNVRPRAEQETGRLGFRRGAEETASIVPEPSVEAIRRMDIESGPGAWERTVQWADRTLEEGRGRVATGIDPTQVAAHAVKMADWVAKSSVKTFDAFREEFVRRFPEAAAMVRDVWNRLTADDASIFKAIDDAAGIEELNEATRSFGGSVTSLAYRVGEMTNTPQKLARLDEGMARFRREASEAMKAGDFDKASALAMKGQFYREAREYATGTASAGEYMRRQQPDFVAPMERNVGELGINRPPVIDRGLAVLTEPEFDAAFRKAKRDIDAAEKRWDEDAITPGELAKAQDSWTPFEMERFRRNQLDTDPRDLMPKFVELADKAESSRNPTDIAKAKILAEELRKSGRTPDHLLSEMRPRGADQAEVLQGKMKNVERFIRNELKQSEPDRVIALLDRGIEALRPDQGRLMEGVTGLPVWLTREAARGVLQAVRLAYVGSKSLASAIDAGVKWMQEQGIKAEPEAMRDWLDSQLRWERIGTEADAGPTKTRGAIERASASKEFTQPVKEMLAQDPRSKYQQQVVAPRNGKTSVSEIVESQSDAQLEDATPNSSIYVSQKLELAKRLMKSGRDEAAYQIFADLAEKGTTFGQLINQFKALKAVDPNYVVRLLNKQLADNGYDPLTEGQAATLAEKSKKAIEANDKLEQAKKDWVDDPTPENAKKAEDLLEQAKAPVMELQRAMLDMQPKSLPATLKAVIQGNLLTPASEVANIAGNMAIMPARAMSEAGAVALDALDSYIRKRPREIIGAPVESLKAGARGVRTGVSQIPAIAKEGISGVRTGENFRDLQPIRAWTKLLAKEPLAPTRGGKVPKLDRAAMLVEGTAGVPAATMLRGLSAGDAPFREKAHAQAVEQQLELAKIPKDARPFARKFPELVLEPEAMKRIQDETARAIFQKDSDAVSALNRFIRAQGKKWLGRQGDDWADLAFTVAVAPYRLTPWNLIGEYLAYSPAGLASVVSSVAKGNKLGAERAAAKVAVGGMAAYAAMWLYQKGLLAPSLDAEDEQQKARLLSGQIMPPDHLNLSGAQRALSGGDPTFQPGDTTVGLEKLGIFGSIAHNMANIGRKKERSPEGEGAGFTDWTFGQIPETAKFALNQSFLKGTATVLDAARTGDFDDVLRNMENIIVSVPLPNTLSAASRATSDYKTVIKDDDKLKEFNNLIQQRLRVFGGGKDLPIKRGVWGEPIPETPQGSNPFAYHFFDITKGQRVTQDAASVEAYRLWRRYNDPAAIPTPPSSSIEIEGERYELTPVQQGELGRLVGEQRKRVADALVANPNWKKLDDDAKRRILKRGYETGLRIGKKLFLAENQAELDARGRPAGFVPR
jgi:hypothetical protein